MIYIKNSKQINFRKKQKKSGENQLIVFFFEMKYSEHCIVNGRKDIQNKRFTKVN